MKIVFFGSDDFAAVNLKALLTEGYSVVACVTQPDKPKGRHLKVVPNEVKEEALKNKIPVLQPVTLKITEIVEQLKKFEADLFVVVAYGKILPPEIIRIPETFCINVHASLLPKYRGAAPINWAIMNGDKVTGVTIMKLNEKLDAGDVLSQKEEEIFDSDTSVSLRSRLASLGAELLLKTIDTIEKKTFAVMKQNEKDVSIAPKLTKEMGLIDFEKQSAEQIHNLVRGLLPWPGAYTYFGGKILKILESHVGDANPASGKPSEVLAIEKEGICVQTVKGVIILRRVQPESGKPMEIKSFLAGHPMKSGIRLGKP